mmetsp:Transcript_9105/g.24545  ORF Transcript_9105/g.24545 Transcript_9105/m.24545 type:complete len:261 (+) Transcript_9105:874-1656(+)
MFSADRRDALLGDEVLEGLLGLRILHLGSLCLHLCKELAEELLILLGRHLNVEVLLVRGRVREPLALGRGHLLLHRRPVVAAVRIAVHLDDPGLEAQVHDLVAGLLQELVVVRDLALEFLLVVRGLGVEELPQDVREGLQLLIRQVLAELRGLAELLVVLAGGLVLHHLPLLRGQAGPPGLEVLLEAAHGGASMLGSDLASRLRRKEGPRRGAQQAQASANGQGRNQRRRAPRLARRHFRSTPKLMDANWKRASVRTPSP